MSLEFGLLREKEVVFVNTEQGTIASRDAEDMLEALAALEGGEQTRRYESLREFLESALRSKGWSSGVVMVREDYFNTYMGIGAEGTCVVGHRPDWSTVNAEIRSGYFAVPYNDVWYLVPK